ncbi:MAG: hypothetical protein ABWJ97_01540 [Thermoproteus sp.]
MDVRTVVELNTWYTPEGTYLRLVVIRGCSNGSEELVVEGADLVFYTCEDIPLRDTTAVYKFFKGIGLDGELVYGETSRVKIFRVKGDYGKLIDVLTSTAKPSTAPSWAQS